VGYLKKFHNYGDVIEAVACQKETKPDKATKSCPRLWGELCEKIAQKESQSGEGPGMIERIKGQEDG